MTVKDFLNIYINSVGANYGIFTEKNHLYLYGCNDTENIIRDFGDRFIKNIEIENESTVGLLIYLKR